MKTFSGFETTFQSTLTCMLWVPRNRDLIARCPPGTQPPP